MEIPNKRFLNPGFYTNFGQATIRKWIEGGMILKVGDEHASEVDSYISQLRASKTTVSFGNKTWSVDLKIFCSYTSLTHAIKAYLLPLLSFSSVMATLEIFPQQKLRVEKYAHFQLRSQHDHFKSRRWCKLNFGLLQGKVKSHHFSERTEAKRQYFYFLHTFFGIFDWKRHWKTLLDTGWDSLLTIWIRLAPE